jgi:hypothetical protein
MALLVALLVLTLRKLADPDLHCRMLALANFGRSLAFPLLLPLLRLLVVFGKSSVLLLLLLLHLLLILVTPPLMLLALLVTYILLSIHSIDALVGGSLLSPRRNYKVLALAVPLPSQVPSSGLLFTTSVNALALLLPLCPLLLPISLLKSLLAEKLVGSMELVFSSRRPLRGRAFIARVKEKPALASALCVLDYSSPSSVLGPTRKARGYTCKRCGKAHTVNNFCFSCCRKQTIASTTDDVIRFRIGNARWKVRLATRKRVASRNYAANVKSVAARAKSIKRTETLRLRKL